MRRYLALVPLLLLPLAACGSTEKVTAGAPPTSATTSSPTKAAPKVTKPPITNLPLGSPITVTGKNDDADIAMTVTTDPTAQTSKKALQQYADAPKATYVGVTVTYDCTAGPCSYNPYDFTLRGADGTEYDKAYDGFKPDLNSGDLATGTKAKGVLTYDLAPGTYSLEYRNNVFSGQVASWVVTSP